ncbi:MAG TPA: Holliday junction resolvase RuvX [Gemmatimonadales bacterium]|jgi:putative Holliday junction resolvase|nr:Holliday junction resolvase RuvX [Gemmatimonadales bacterium]
MTGGGTLPASGRLLAVDWGTKRIGLALSDPSQTLAQPLATLTRRAGRRFPMAQLRAHLERHTPVGVVVGLPLDEDGHEGTSARAARAAAELIAEKSGLPVALWDESFTTARVHDAVHALGGRPATRPHDVDQLAAVVILQSFLDRRQTG